MRRNLAIATITMMIAASPVFAVGTVNQVVSPIGRDPGSNPDNRVHQLAINWTADASIGTVPVTALNLGAFPAIQGMRLVSVEIKPGSPAPTNLYSITITDSLGIDLLSGTGLSLSNTTATSTTISNLAAPVFGSLTFTLTNNSVNSATGSVYLFFAPLTQTTITTGTPSLTGANTFTGTNTFTGPLNCKNFENVYCIDTSNTQGWAGSDLGAQLNSIIAQAACGNFCSIVIAPGTYSMNTAVSFTTSLSINCPAPVTGGSNAVINWTPATGTVFQSTTTGASFQFTGCFLQTTTSTTSVAIQLKATNNSHIEHFHIRGFSGGIQVTGDGVSQVSSETFINHGRIDVVCGSGNYGLNLDHAFDVWLDNIAVYPVTTDCATHIPFILDTDVGGLWFSNGTLEQGLHAGVIRNTNQGGAYGPAPSALFLQSVAFDLSPGGSALLLDATLGTANIQLFCDLCWMKAAGINSAGTTVTAAAAGVDIEGGSNINFWAGTMSKNAGWAYINNSTGTDFSVTSVQAVSNNRGNTAGVGGFQITANPSFVRIIGNRSGNDTSEPGGNQAYGMDASVAASGAVYFTTNDFKGNNTARMKLPAAMGSLSVDVPEIGSSPNGVALMGPTQFIEGTGLGGVSGSDECLGNVQQHEIDCSYNNGAIGRIPLIQIGDSVFGTFRVTADQTITAGASLTAIPGLSWTMPANVALNIKFSCDLLYSQATAAASDSFGFQDVTVAPTNAEAYARADTSATAFTAGNTTAAGVTTSVTVVTFTPSAAATVFGAHIDGMIEQPSNASTSAFQIQAQFTTNNGTIKRGSSCQVF